MLSIRWVCPCAVRRRFPGNRRDNRDSVSTSSQNRYAPLPLFLAAAVFILTGPVFWIGVEAPGGDRPVHVAENSALFQQVYPAMHYGFGRLAQGEFPLWNNRQLCGVPFFADPRNAVLQPLNAVFFFLETSRAMAVHAFLSLSLMGFFFVVFMRSMNLRYIPAVLGGMAYMCCGATAAAMSRPACVNALVWLPLLLCLVREFMTHRPCGLLVAAGGIVTALLMLSGAPLMIFTTLVLAFGYGAIALLRNSPATEAAGQTTPYNRWERLRGLLMMACLGIALSCVQWLPAVAWVRGLDAPLSFLAQFSVDGEAPHTLRGLLAQLLEAHAAHLPALAYLGVSALLLIPSALFHSIPRWERWFFFVCAATLVLLPLGRLESESSVGALLALAYPASFAACVLTALGADRLFAVRRDPLTPRLWGPLVLIAVVFVLVFLIVPDTVRGRMLPGAAAIALFAVFRTTWAGVLSGVILLVFQFIDLNASLVNHQGHPFFARESGVTVEEPLASLVRETALDDRVLVSAYPGECCVHPNMGMSSGFRMAGASGIPLTPEQRVWWEALEQAGIVNAATPSLATPRAAEADDNSQASSRAGLLDVMAVRAMVIAGQEESGVPALADARLRRRGGHGDVSVYANEDVVPRVSWSPSWQIALEIRAAIEALCAPDFDSRKKCIVVPVDTALSHLVNVIPEPAPASGPEAAMPEAQANLMLLDDLPEEITISVDAPAPGIVVLSDTYDADWRATVNGTAAPILRVNGLFRGVALPEGKNMVSFVYRPRFFYIGALVSGFTLAALFLRGLHALARKRLAQNG